MKLICVDDDPAILAVLKVSLETVGNHSVDTAGSGQAAIDSFVSQNAEVECFLLDIQMPGMTGVELCEVIRSHDAYRDTPILMLTAMSDEDYIEAAFAAGATDYVTKPFDPNDLNTRVKSAVARMQSLAKQKVDDALPQDAGAAAIESAAPAPLATPADSGPAPAFVPGPSFSPEVAKSTFPPRPQPGPAATAPPSRPSFQAVRQNLAQSRPAMPTSRPAMAEMISPLRMEPLRNLESISKAAESAAAATQEADEPVAKTRVGLDEPYNLTCSKRFLAHSTFENFLETMNSNSKKDVHIFSLGIKNVGEIFDICDTRQFKFLINQAAVVVAELLRPHRSMFSYFGNGVFCGTVRDTGVKYIERFPEMFDDAICGLNDGNNILVQANVALVVGATKSPSMFHSPISRLRKSISEMEEELL
ncbi:response regulator [Shimia sp.]|uniref:response regulator n=1 Tax=Shimia sp. TaxID=1954381 RepID=UPI0035629460